MHAYTVVESKCKLRWSFFARWVHYIITYETKFGLISLPAMLHPLYRVSFDALRRNGTLSHAQLHIHTSYTKP